jgi:hypothetical protein
MKLGIVSVTLNAVNPIVQFLNYSNEEIEYLNYLDSGLMERVNRDGLISDTSMNRMKMLIMNAKSDEVDGVLLTCTVFSPFTDDFSKEFGIPVIAADRAMIETAIYKEEKTAILYTFPSAKLSTQNLIRDIEARTGKMLDCDLILVEHAFEELKKGNLDSHDRLITEKIRNIEENYGLILLAQISMVGAIANFNSRIQVLTSPTSALGELKNRLKQRNR